ncbi:hypothetical protein MANES_01G010150v8 [Manihot esculenta]|uniref:Uncharacterized protein n=1 Tax=Manihot esculenta TaxID=3983 RepID=A0ACB7I8W4_MANES|nr:hypothetical protein MANES_01G010150v8 [Manihot esculenta]
MVTHCLIFHVHEYFFLQQSICNSSSLMRLFRPSGDRLCLLTIRAAIEILLCTLM